MSDSSPLNGLGAVEVAGGNSGRSGELFGHPRGLYVLFFTELWERFSFYGMKTLLVLYMINHFFWTQADASHLLGIYAFLAYGLPVVGGFIADRWLGAKRAVLLGGILLAIGHFLMAFEPLPFFYSALALIIMGVGLLKPNVSTQVGSLYKPSDPRRDGAFTIFYMGINLGALIGPLLCDWLRVHYGWHYGFAAAGIGMVLGLIVYAIGQRKLVEFNQDVGDAKPGEKPRPADHHPPHVVSDRVIVLLVVFVFVILFWTAFEQSPNAMLVWADKHTNLRLLPGEPAAVTLDQVAATTQAAASQPNWWAKTKNWFNDPTITSGQTQSFNPFFIIVLAPLFAFFWVWLDRRKLQPSTPTKMALGLALVAVAFAVMWPAAQYENRPSTATLSKLPAVLHVDDDGRLFTGDVQAAASERVYYGATRLKYNAEIGELQTAGVLTDLDRLRLLAATAPPDLIADVEEFAERSARQPSREEYVSQLRLVETVRAFAVNMVHLAEVARTDSAQCYRELTVLVERADADARAKAEQGWRISTILESVPDGIGPVEIMEGQGENRKRVLTWDPAGKLLTAYREIKERSRIEFLAAAAQADFKQAIDQIYLDSARFRVSVWWLIAFFMVLTMGELCLSPVGLSLVTKLAPPKNVGLFMGGWFLATAIAEYSAQVFGAYWGKLTPATYFLIFVIMCGVGALLMAALIRPLKRMMHGVQ